MLCPSPSCSRNSAVTPRYPCVPKLPSSEHWHLRSVSHRGPTGPRDDAAGRIRTGGPRFGSGCADCRARAAFYTGPAIGSSSAATRHGQSRGAAALWPHPASLRRKKMALLALRSERSVEWSRREARQPLRDADSECSIDRGMRRGSGAERFVSCLTLSTHPSKRPSFPGSRARFAHVPPLALTVLAVAAAS